MNPFLKCKEITVKVQIFCQGVEGANTNTDLTKSLAIRRTSPLGLLLPKKGSRSKHKQTIRSKGKRKCPQKRKIPSATLELSPLLYTLLEHSKAAGCGNDPSFFI